MFRIFAIAAAFAIGPAAAFAQVGSADEATTVCAIVGSDGKCYDSADAYADGNSIDFVRSPSIAATSEIAVNGTTNWSHDEFDDPAPRIVYTEGCTKPGTAMASHDEFDDPGPRIVYTAGGYDEFDDPGPRIAYNEGCSEAGIGVASPDDFDAPTPDAAVEVNW